MKPLFFVLTLFISGFIAAQSIWTFDSTKMKLYNSIVEYNQVYVLGFSESEDDPFLWKQADSFFQSMPLDVALKYYSDTSYPIRFYSFLKIIGLNDSIAFSLLPKYITDSTNMLCTVGDVADDVPFNRLLAHQYERFIDSKYYWCDTLFLWSRNYFRKETFGFPKVNYGSWPRILTSYIEFLRPYHIATMHKLDELKHYRGVKYFYGRN